MKTAEYSSLGLVVKLNVPESVEEFDANAKKAGECLNQAVNNIVYRGALAEFRDIFLHGDATANPPIQGVEQVTSIGRKLKSTGKKDESGNDITAYDETEGTYFERVLAETGKKAEDFQALADTVSASIIFDASARERKAPSGPKKLGKTWTDAAEQLIAKDNISSFATRYEKLLGKPLAYTAGEDKAKNVLSLAGFVKEFIDEKNKADVAKAIA